MGGIKLCVVLLYVLSSCISAAADGSLLPRGEAFGDWQKALKMGDGWQQKPIVHPAGAKTMLLINLDQSTYPVFANILEQYGKDNDLNLLVHSGTCGISNRGFLKKEIDMGSFCCPPGADDRYPGVIFHTLGISALEIIVNPQNPVQNVTFSQAQQLFSGEIDRWSQLSLPSSFDYPVQPVAFIHCKKRPGHWRLLLDNENLFSPRLQNVITIPDIVSAVAGNKMAVSMAMVPLARDVNRDRGKVRGIKIDNIKSDDLDALVHGSYPLYRVLSLAYWQNGPHQNDVRRLLAFLDRYIKENSAKLSFVPASRLRRAGWRFNGEELISAPSKQDQ